jgi:hypothetical protein
MAVSVGAPVLRDARRVGLVSVDVPPAHKPAATVKEVAREANLALMPPYPELQRNALKTDLPLDALMQILSSFMRVNSISYQLKHEEDRLFLDCTTPNMVRFVVNLWRGQGTEIVVQMERQRGCAVETQQFRRCLFRAIQAGGESTRLISVQAKRRICPRHIKKQFEESHNNSKEKDAIFCVNKCRELMESRCCDRQRLALEYLVRLTDPSSVSPLIAEIVSKMLLIGDSSVSAYSIRTMFAVHIQKCRQSQNSLYLQDQVEQESASTHCSSTIMHSLALKALSNALEVLVSRKSSRISHLFDLNSEFWVTISCALVQNVMDAVERPQDSALSATCLCLIKKLSASSSAPVSNLLSMQDQLTTHLVQAKQYGKTHHAELERASHNLIVQLEGRVQHTLRNVFFGRKNNDPHAF